MFVRRIKGQILSPPHTTVYPYAYLAPGYPQPSPTTGYAYAPFAPVTYNPQYRTGYAYAPSTPIMYNPQSGTAYAQPQPAGPTLPTNGILANIDRNISKKTSKLAELSAELVRHQTPRWFTRKATREAKAAATQHNINALQKNLNEVKTRKEERKKALKERSDAEARGYTDNYDNHDGYNKYVKQWVNGTEKYLGKLITINERRGGGQYGDEVTLVTYVFEKDDGSTESLYIDRSYSNNQPFPYLKFLDDKPSAPPADSNKQVGGSRKRKASRRSRRRARQECRY